jgi:hypothetical protein
MPFTFDNLGRLGLPKEQRNKLYDEEGIREHAYVVKHKGKGMQSFGHQRDKRGSQRDHNF